MTEVKNDRSYIKKLLLIAVPMIYSALLPHSGTDSMVACNLDGQEEAVIQCANKLLT